MAIPVSAYPTANKQMELLFHSIKFDSHTTFNPLYQVFYVDNWLLLMWFRLSYDQLSPNHCLKFLSIFYKYS